MITKSLINGLKNYFSLKKNNRFSLTDDDNLDRNIKNVMVGDKLTPLALSEDQIRVIAEYITLNGYVKLNGSTVELGGQQTSATVKSPALTLESAGDITLDSDGDVSVNVDGQDIFFKYLGITLFQWNAIGGMTMFSAADQDDSCQFTVGLNGSLTVGTTDDTGNFNGHMTLNPQGHISFSNNPVGFSTSVVTYNATDTNVNYFTDSNKAYLTFGAASTAITDLNLKFPGLSGNFVLVVQQHGSGGGSITNYKTFDRNGSNESTVAWPGGTKPTLSTGANAIDILTFYWDSTTNKAYGVASLNFSHP